VLSRCQNEKDKACEVDARDEIRHSPVSEPRHHANQAPTALDPSSMIKTARP
jgi:hypothetical protein